MNELLTTAKAERTKESVMSTSSVLDLAGQFHVRLDRTDRAHLLEQGGGIVGLERVLVGEFREHDFDEVFRRHLAEAAGQG